jgi:hypothetical protein
MHTVQTTLRKMLLDSSDEIYWRRMCQDITLYSSCTVHELLGHMETTYGTFTDAERCLVTSRMDVPWEGGPLEAVIQQIEEASEAFGLGGAALTETQKRDRLYDLINASNLMPDACQRWRMRPEPEKTWNNACTHFQQFANDRDKVQTAGGAGYHANHIELALAANSDALTDLNNQMANLGTTNTTQAATILDLMTRLAAANAAHQAYRDNNTNRQGNNGRNNSRPQQATTTASTHNTRAPSRYCWTHGSCAHHGTACRTQRDGHQAAATFANRLNGSNLNCGS